MAEDRRLTDQGRERKAQLLDHAAELFAERGYAETRVSDIVAAAGVAKGLFYWYFENKDALFRELVERNRLRLRQAQAAAIAADDERSGHVVKIVAVRRDPALTEAALIEHCRRSLTGYKVPKLVEFRAELPKTNVGKILRRALRDETVAKA